MTHSYITWLIPRTRSSFITLVTSFYVMLAAHQHCNNAATHCNILQSINIHVLHVNLRGVAGTPTLQHTATTLQHTATYYNRWTYAVLAAHQHCNILQQHCNTLQHHCNTLQHTTIDEHSHSSRQSTQCWRHTTTVTHCNNPATHCNTLQSGDIHALHVNLRGVGDTLIRHKLPRLVRLSLLFHLHYASNRDWRRLVCCRVLQCVLQFVADCWGVLQVWCRCVAVWCSINQPDLIGSPNGEAHCVALCCIVLHCVEVCWGVL